MTGKSRIYLSAKYQRHRLSTSDIVKLFLNI